MADGIDQTLRARWTETSARVCLLRREIALMIEASADANADDEHDPEGATIAFERAQLAALEQDATQHAWELEQALNRLAAGSYGLCMQCGLRISPERLQARPASRACMRCASSRRSG